MAALTLMLQICRFFLPTFGGRMASAFSLVKSRSLYLVIGPIWQKFMLLTIPHYDKIDWPMTLFCTRSPPFMSSHAIFLQAKWSKIKERMEGWKSGKKMWFKRIAVCLNNIGKITKCMSVNYYICSRNTHFSRLCWSSGIKARLISFSLSSALCPLCQHLVPFAILGVSAGIKAMAVQWARTKLHKY